jgi:chromosomal replication initiation ATPase DnaA
VRGIKQKALLATSQACGVSTSEILGKRRDKKTSLARKITAYAIWKHCGGMMTAREIGEFLMRDRTYILYTVNQIEGWIDIYDDIRELYEEVDSKIKGMMS